MTTTMQLTIVENERLGRPRGSFGTGPIRVSATNGRAGPDPDHTEFVRESTARLLNRYAALFDRLARL